ncbi:hypothetical protein J6590_033345 [Homalodisca vitripennis]|nr:hypothetical protein J6590_033345 [Homalodisca vitripennis]
MVEEGPRHQQREWGVSSDTVYEMVLGDGGKRFTPPAARVAHGEKGLCHQQREWCVSSEIVYEMVLRDDGGIAARVEHGTTRWRKKVYATSSESGAWYWEMAEKGSRHQQREWRVSSDTVYEMVLRDGEKGLRHQQREWCVSSETVYEMVLRDDGGIAARVEREQ